jgi:hypothetical protein
MISRWVSGSRSVITLAAVATVLCALLPAAGAQATASSGASGTWGQAQVLPGYAALSHGGADVTALSCGSPGNCALAGFYDSHTGAEPAFVASEVNGTWQKARPVPGIAALTPHGTDDQVYAVSCTRSGYCVAGGSYRGSAGDEAFLITAVHGRWGSAQEVPGTAQLNQGGDAGLYAVSCPAAGNCTAGGGYTDSGDYGQAFMLSEHDGTWSGAQQVPGTGTGDFASRDPEIDSISCPSAGNCSASGDMDSPQTAFLVNEQHGTWHPAELVPGLDALNTGSYAVIADVSCPSAGNCGAGGLDSHLSRQGKPGYYAFVVNEAGGVWRKVSQVAGYAAFHGYDLEISSVSCGSPGNCSAVGTASSTFQDRASNEAFLVSEQDGTWGPATLVPGVPVAPANAAETFTSVSCTGLGDCSAGGSYYSTAGQQAFVIGQSGSTWGTAEVVPGLDALDQDGAADLDALSCSSPGQCTAAGAYYPPGSSTGQIYVVSES